MREIVHVAAPVATLMGVLLSAIGTYLTVQWYHPFNKTGFWMTMWRICGLVIARRVDKAKKKTEFASKLAAINLENRTDLLTGIYFVFIGFVFQGCGAFFWCIDAMVDLSQKS